MHSLTQHSIVGVAEGDVQLVGVYSPLNIGPQHWCSKCGGVAHASLPGVIDVAAKHFLAKGHTPIKHTSPGVVTSENVLFLDHVKQSTVERYSKYKPHISQGNFHILIAMHHHINAAKQLCPHFAAMTNDQVIFVGARKPLIV